MEINTKHYQQLQLEERVTISSLKQQNYGVRAIAQVLKRFPQLHQPRTGPK